MPAKDTQTHVSNLLLAFLPSLTYSLPLPSSLPLPHLIHSEKFHCTIRACPGTIPQLPTVTVTDCLKGNEALLRESHAKFVFSTCLDTWMPEALD